MSTVTRRERRRDQPGYDAPIRNTAAGSVLEYYETVLAIRDAEPQAWPWMSPKTLTDDMPFAVRNFWLRVNPDLVEFERRMLAPVTALIKQVDPDADLTTGPAKEIVDTVAELQRRYLDAVLLRPLEVSKRRSLDDPRYRHELGVRVIWSAKSIFDLAPTALAEFLNEGSHPRAGAGITRDSVRSVERTVVGWARGKFRGKSGEFFALMVDDKDDVEAAEYLRQKAKQDARFAKLRGAALAFGVHDQIDLNEALHRARACIVRGSVRGKANTISPVE